jgi:hypothetical protein
MRASPAKSQPLGSPQANAAANAESFDFGDDYGGGWGGPSGWGGLTPVAANAQAFTNAGFGGFGALSSSNAAANAQVGWYKGRKTGAAAVRGPGHACRLCRMCMALVKWSGDERAAA